MENDVFGNCAQFATICDSLPTLCDSLPTLCDSLPTLCDSLRQSATGCRLLSPEQLPTGPRACFPSNCRPGLPGFSPSNCPGLFPSVSRATQVFAGSPSNGFAGSPRATAVCSPKPLTHENAWTLWKIMIFFLTECVCWMCGSDAVLFVALVRLTYPLTGSPADVGTLNLRGLLR
jgi:hypothetical protein